MIRKSLFWGLTLVLAVALISLIVRGRRIEKQQSVKAVEVVRESKPTPTRVLAPQDLEITHLKMSLEKEPDGKTQSQTARNEVEIHNKGKVPYERIQLSFDYLDRRGKLLEARAYSVAKTIMPGAVLDLADIRINGLPVGIADSRVSIIYADIGQ